MVILILYWWQQHNQSNGPGRLRLGHSVLLKSSLRLSLQSWQYTGSIKTKNEHNGSCIIYLSYVLCLEAHSNQKQFVRNCDQSGVPYWNIHVHWIRQQILVPYHKLERSRSPQHEQATEYYPWYDWSQDSTPASVIDTILASWNWEKSYAKKRFLAFRKV